MVSQPEEIAPPITLRHPAQDNHQRPGDRHREQQADKAPELAAGDEPEHQHQRVHADMPAATQDKLRQAFLDLKADSADGKEVLALQRATRFVPTKVDNYKGIEAAARSAGLLK